MEVHTMYCKSCRNVIRQAKTFQNLLNFEIPEICKHCFKLHMQHFPYFVVPIQNGLLHVFELLTKETNQPGDYLYYFRPYYQAYFKVGMTIDCIYIEKLTPKTIELFDQMNLGHLIIFTNNFKEE